MAVTSKALFRGAATTTTTTTLYTVPSSTTTVVSNIVVSSAGTARTFTLYLNGVLLANAVSIAANSTTTIDLKQVLATTNTIQGGASATDVMFHISGVEIS